MIKLVEGRVHSNIDSVISDYFKFKLSASADYIDHNKGMFICAVIVSFIDEFKNMSEYFEYNVEEKDLKVIVIEY